MRLSIRSEQMSVIEAVAEEDFVRRIAAHLLENYSKAMVTLPEGEKFPVDQLSEEVLHALIRVGIKRARSYEMTFESSIAAFTAVMFEIAPNFYDHRLSQVLLNDEEVEPNSRLDELIKVLTEKNWESIRAIYDPKAWEFIEEDQEQDSENSDEKSKEENKNPEDGRLASDFEETIPNY